jgi:DNA-binding GntR family transcriptional regulator
MGTAVDRSGAAGDPAPVARARRRAVRAAPRPRSRNQKSGAGTLADQAYRSLEELITTLRLAPGATVSEGQLAERVGMGRTPIREALHRLAREHLIVIMPRRGILVAPIDVAAQMRLLEVRRSVESMVAAAAARKASGAERERFAELARRFVASAERNDDVSFMRTDREFNDALIEIGRNEFAAAAMALMSGLARRFWFLHWRQAADMPLAARLHAAIADAVARGRPDDAIQSTGVLIDYLESFTRASLDRR